MNTSQLQRKVLIKRELSKRKSARKTVVGIVDAKEGLTKSLIKQDGEWIKTNTKPSVYIAAPMERVLKSDKRFIVVIGGRGGTKSIGGHDICLIGAKDDEEKTYYLREYQSSIRNSVQSLLEGEIERLEFKGFEVMGQTILFNNKPIAEFTGLARNVESIMSAYGFKRYCIEQAEFLTEKSLGKLTPTVRNKPNKGLPGEKVGKEKENNVSMMFIANPSSREDPFSKRFILPFIDEVLDKGFYEDDLHLIVMINYMDNPWFEESGLEGERMWDKAHMSDAYYRHRWLAGFNDTVEDALILESWFDACIDAHLKLGFVPRGTKIVSHDPSDTGFDTKGHAFRHGSVFLDVSEKTDGDINAGGHWSSAKAITQQADYYTWDGDGMGCGLNEQLGRDFMGKQTKIVMFKGSEGPDNPDTLYKPAVGIADQKTVKEVFKNKRNQYYWELRDRIYRTYRAVIHGEYHDPDLMISFSSDIESIGKLRSELSRLPIKPNANGFLTLYTKEEMKSKFHIDSQNLGDPVMMSMRYIPPVQQAYMPPPVIRPMGVQRGVR